MIHSAVQPQLQTTSASANLCIPDLNYTRTSWVKLHHLPNPYSFDEALLLCQESAEQWRAWVPDHGEIMLHHSEFYC
ncbi:MAG: hypothetical protein F6J87_11275 [Spirulina sp. SIO3F2]|nr:hypothetical protein [Spirulina sp. SIO3F2]